VWGSRLQHRSCKHVRAVVASYCPDRPSETTRPAIEVAGAGGAGASGRGAWSRDLRVAPGQGWLCHPGRGGDCRRIRRPPGRSSHGPTSAGYWGCAMPLRRRCCLRRCPIPLIQADPTCEFEPVGSERSRLTN
jgi:hypothetical protein